MTKKKKQKKQEKAKIKFLNIISFEKVAFFLIWIGFIITFFVIILFVFRESHPFGISEHNFELFGQLGEYIGGIVGSIWALAGVILFYEALKFSRVELTLQREELKHQREEIMEQTNQYIIQNQTLLTRKLEGTFFQLITLHNEIVSQMELNLKNYPEYNFETKKKNVRGRYCFNNFYSIFNKILSDNIDLTGVVAAEKEDLKAIMGNSYKQFFITFQEDLGHYFRNLFNLILYVDQSNLNNKRFYINLVRSQLSNYEILLLFYHCLSVFGERLKPLIEKYSFFVQLSSDKLIDRRHKDMFNTSAFEDKIGIQLDDNILLRKRGRE